jgi:hypothetical protein
LSEALIGALIGAVIGTWGSPRKHRGDEGGVVFIEENEGQAQVAAQNYSCHKTLGLISDFVVGQSYQMILTATTYDLGILGWRDIRGHDEWGS